MLERFQDRYGLHRTDIYAEMERAVIGDVCGATGYTTVAQADRLARVLRLRPGMRVLDIGAGRGYPSLHLAATTGCDVVAADLPQASLQSARKRAARLRLGRRAAFVRASAPHGPFRAGSFDAVVHTDVMCCLGPKQAALRKCYEALRPGGRMAFYTIYIPEGLSARDYERAKRSRGRNLASRKPYMSLMRDAGFEDVRVFDATRAFGATSRRWHEQSARFEQELRALIGDAKFEDDQRSRLTTLRAVSDGIVARGLFVGTRPR